MSPKTEIILEVQLIQDGDFVVAYNPELKISSFGRTVEDAFEAFDEMLQLWVEETKELGTIDALLQRAGLKHSNLTSEQPSDFKISEADASSFYQDVQKHIIETRQKRLEFA